MFFLTLLPRDPKRLFRSLAGDPFLVFAGGIGSLLADPRLVG